MYVVNYWAELSNFKKDKNTIKVAHTPILYSILPILWSHMITWCVELKFRPAFTENHFSSCSSLITFFILHIYVAKWIGHMKTSSFLVTDNYEWDFRATVAWNLISDNQVSVHKAIAWLQKTYFYIYLFSRCFQSNLQLKDLCYSSEVEWSTFMLYYFWSLTSVITINCYCMETDFAWGEKSLLLKTAYSLEWALPLSLNMIYALCEFTIIFCRQISLLLFGSLLVW